MSQVFRPVLFVLIIETIAMVVLALLISTHKNFDFISALIGGGLFVLANGYFTFLTFRYRGSDAAPWIVRSFYRGEMGKIVLVMVGFAVVFRLYPHVNAPALFAAFFALVIIHWFVADAVSKRL